MSLDKNSFTIIETLLSIIIFSAIVGTFFKILTIKENKINIQDINTQIKEEKYIKILKDGKSENLLINTQSLKSNKYHLLKYSLK